MSRGSNGLRARIDSRSATVGVVGLGYVGLPLAIEFARAGFRVAGIELDETRVAQVNRGESYIGDLRSEEVAAVRHSGRFSAGSSWDVAATADAIIICVPTPFNANREPDLSFVRAAVEEIARRLRPGQLIVLESTTYPGTTEEVLLPIIAQSGLCIGRTSTWLTRRSGSTPATGTSTFPTRRNSWAA
jgi:UDP-N-acetyl-D-glucosamine dehydrogenase